MVQLNRIAKEEVLGKPFILLGHSMGSFASQQYVVDHSREVDGLILSGSGALDGLAGRASSAPAGTNILNAGFEPARTPFDWLSRDSAIVDAFIHDPLCFAQLQPAATASFLAASHRLSDPASLRGICGNLPIYMFSGSEDPVAPATRRSPGLNGTLSQAASLKFPRISTPVDATKCSMRSTASNSAHTCFARSSQCWKGNREEESNAESTDRIVPGRWSTLDQETKRTPPMPDVIFERACATSVSFSGRFIALLLYSCRASVRAILLFHSKMMARMRHDSVQTVLPQFHRTLC